MLHQPRFSLRTDQRTDRPSYRDGRTHLKSYSIQTANKFSSTRMFSISPRLLPLPTCRRCSPKPCKSEIMFASMPSWARKEHRPNGRYGRMVKWYIGLQHHCQSCRRRQRGFISRRRILIRQRMYWKKKVARGRY